MGSPKFVKAVQQCARAKNAKNVQKEEYEIRLGCCTLACADGIDVPSEVLGVF